MSITLETIESFLLCNYKAYLKIRGVCWSKSDYEVLYEVLYNELKESLFETVTNDLISKQYTCLNLNATIITASVLQHDHDYLINGRLLHDDIHVNRELLEKSPQKSNLTKFFEFCLSRVETAFLSASGVGWLYRIVIWIEECPKSLDTIAR
jgi:hypothetical protein